MWENPQDPGFGFLDPGTMAMVAVDSSGSPLADSAYEPVFGAFGNGDVFTHIRPQNREHEYKSISGGRCCGSCQAGSASRRDLIMLSAAKVGLHTSAHGTPAAPIPSRCRCLGNDSISSLTGGAGGTGSSRNASGPSHQDTPTTPGSNLGNKRDRRHLWRTTDGPYAKARKEAERRGGASSPDGSMLKKRIKDCTYEVTKYFHMEERISKHYGCTEAEIASAKETLENECNDKWKEIDCPCLPLTGQKKGKHPGCKVKVKCVVCSQPVGHEGYRRNTTLMSAVSAAVVLHCKDAIPNAGDSLGLTSPSVMRLLVRDGAVAPGVSAHEIGHALGLHLPPGGSQVAGDLSAEDYERVDGKLRNKKGREGSVMGTVDPDAEVKKWTTCELVRKETLCPAVQGKGKRKSLKCCPNQREWRWVPGTNDGGVIKGPGRRPPRRRRDMFMPAEPNPVPPTFLDVL